MNHESRNLHLPSPFERGASPAARPVTRPGIQANLGTGVIARKVRPASAPPVYRPQPATAPLQANRPSMTGSGRQPGAPPPVYNPFSPSQAGRFAALATPASGWRTGTAPPVYRPAAQSAAQAQAKTPSFQAKSVQSATAHKAGSAARYVLQAPMVQATGVQEIRVGLPGSPGTVGSVRLHPAKGGRVYISDLEVSPDHRRHGVARMLVNAALRTATAQGRRGAVLEAEPGAQSISKQALISMYQKLGFRQAGLSSRGKPLMEFGPVAIQRQLRSDNAFPVGNAARKARSRAPVASAGAIQRAKAPSGGPVRRSDERRGAFRDNPYGRPPNPYGPPSDRPRRGVAHYSNVVAQQTLGSDKRARINAAIRNKVVFSGSRDQVSWSTGFPQEYWEAAKETGGWSCARGFAGCLQPNPINDHSNLEIGHQESFYNVVVNRVDPEVACDGENHWEVYLYQDIVEANEDLGNLYPICTACNRHPSEKKKDDQGGGKYQPEDRGACPGEGCSLRKI